jgi:hypothetical protein
MRNSNENGVKTPVRREDVRGMKDNVRCNMENVRCVSTNYE